MAPFEETFVREIKRTVQTSLQFRRAVLEGLTDFMGETPAEILVMGISDTGFRSPAQFVREVSKTFGHGSAPMYEAILSTAASPAWQGRTEPQLRARTGGLAPGEVGSLVESARTTYMHDQRDPDEFAEEDPH